MHSILLCPEVRIDEERLVGDYDLDNIKRLLLYWDELSLISYIHAPVERDAHLNHLKSEGILKFINVSGGLPLSDSITGETLSGLPRDMGFRKLTAEMNYDAFLQKLYFDRSSAKDKVLGFEEPPWGMRLINKNMSSAPVLQTTLQSCLPNPSSNSSFEDILRFKEKRQDELNRLRIEIERYIRDIEEASDPNRAEYNAFAELLQALDDLKKVSREASFFTRTFHDLRLTHLAGAAAATSALAGGAATPLIVGGAVTIAIAEAFIYQKLKEPSSVKLNGYKYAISVANM